jgi:hypothetical protein
LETRFEYALPDRILHLVDGAIVYELVVQKQPGTGAVPLYVRVLLAPDVRVKMSEPQPTTVTESGPEYVLSLATDQHLTLSLVADPPTGTRSN